VRGYAQGLNSNQGLGFCFLGQRVPRDFVLRTIVRGCVLMCLVLGLGLLALDVVTRPALDRSQMLTFLVRAFPGLMCRGWAHVTRVLGQSQVAAPPILVAASVLGWWLAEARGSGADGPLGGLENRWATPRLGRTKA